MDKKWLIRYRRREHLCLDCGAPAEQLSETKWHSLCARCRSKRNESSGSLCWHCAHSVPDKLGRRGCDWSTKRKPVEGWTATQTRMRAIEGGDIISYFVTKCPKFKRG